MSKSDTKIYQITAGEHSHAACLTGSEKIKSITIRDSPLVAIEGSSAPQSFSFDSVRECSFKLVRLCIFHSLARLLRGFPISPLSKPVGANASANRISPPLYLGEGSCVLFYLVCLFVTKLAVASPKIPRAHSLHRS